MLLIAIEAMYPGVAMIHVFLDNARYRHAKLVQQWLGLPGCRVELNFIPVSCPHLDAIGRLRGFMHRHTAHNKGHARFEEFKASVLEFLRDTVPRN
jgi:hypothetical protein